MKKHLKPSRAGLKVAFAGRPGQYLDAAGELVSVSSYWTRRLNSGDVVEVLEDAPAKTLEPELKTKTATAPTRRKTAK
jgi:hypothetical protein